MKKLLLLITCLSILSINIIDNRDYSEDGYEVYVFYTHVGYIYQNLDFEYSLTGR